MKKSISLKNGASATLSLNVSENSYSIYAYDSNRNLIGKCLFNIEHVFYRKLSDNERKIYARNHKIPLSQAPLKAKTKPEGIEKYLAEAQSSNAGCNSPTNKPTLSQDGKTLTLASGKQYEIDQTKCTLLQIEILDEKYYKVGLGWSMHHQMLEIAKKHNCEKIHAFCFPHGNFLFGTQQFYKRNGYRFTTEGGMTYVTKDLTQKECQLEKIN